MNKQPYLRLAIFLFLLLSAQLRAQVVINEFSASNLSQYVDNHSDYNDWIELYNNSASTINLGGYYLSDDTAQATKWRIPASVSIAPFGFARFWASGRNEVIGVNYHCNFSLKQTKSNHEVIILSDPFGNKLDYFDIHKKTQLGHSYGRKPDGSNNWGVFITPSPGSSNNSLPQNTGYVPKPNFSVAPGFYTSAVSVDITCADSTASIRYTLDGSQPTASSALYVAPLQISTTTVLKAIAINFTSGKLPSLITYQTYFINVNHSLPVVSISATNLANLANNITASLRPFGSFEYFNANQQMTGKSYGEFNRHGKDSWSNSQRSLDYISRDEMGYNHAVEEQVFNTTDMDKFQRLILRAAGDDNYPADFDPSNAGSAHVRDAFIHNVVIQDKLNLDARRGSKCVVYLNGQYWGVYDLRDNPDDHDNTEYYYGQDKYHLYYLETWGQTWAEYGGQAALNEWSALRTYILTHNMAVQANYDYVDERLDVKSLVDYVAVNMFTVCSDWLNYNTAWWRGLDSTGTHLKWGYTLWDNDATYGHYINYTNIPDTSSGADPCDPEGLNSSSDPQDHIGILLALRQNPAFNQYYINRLLDLWNTTFSCSNLLAKLDSTVNLIDPEMAQHSNRWFGTYNGWRTNVAKLRNFISNRCGDLTSGFMSCYSLTGPYSLTLDAQPAGWGAVQYNSLELNQLPWTGTYFGNMPGSLVAKADTGYSFLNWTSASQIFIPNNNSDSAMVVLNASDTLVAHFSNPTNVYGLTNQSFSVSVSPTVVQSQTKLRFNLDVASTVAISLLSPQGKEIQIKSPNSGKLSAGNYLVNLDLSSQGLAAGMYLLLIKTESKQASVKVLYSPGE